LQYFEIYVLVLFMHMALTLTDRFSQTLDGLARAVAARIKGGALSAVMILMIWKRVRRTERLVQGLLTRFRAGRLRVVSGTRVGGRAGRGAGGAVSLPRRFGWLLPLVPGEAACFASQMRGTLAEPEMVALLGASPRARLVLAPLCRMLGIEAAVLGPRRGRPDPGLSEEVGVAGPEMSDGRAYGFVAVGGVPGSRHVPRRRSAIGAHRPAPLCRSG
jgi:hypothetical protein